MAKCRELLAHGNPQEVYFALWAMAFTDALEAISAALSVLNDPLPGRRLAAVHLLNLLSLPQAQQALLPLLDDQDLRLAFHAFTGISMDLSSQAWPWPWFDIKLQPLQLR